MPMQAEEEHDDSQLEGNDEMRDDSIGGASEVEAAQRRAAMRDNAIKGGGEGGGPASSRDSISAAPNRKPDYNNKGILANDTPSRLTLLRGGKDNKGASTTSKKGEPNTGKKVLNGIKAVRGNRKAIAGLGGGGVAVFIFVLGFLGFAQFKILHIMENMELHYFSRNNHMYEVRRDAIMREFYNNHLGQPDSNIDDATATLSQQLMRRFHDGLEPRLREKYKIEVRQGQLASSKHIKFTDKRTGQVTEFDTATQKKEARAFTNQVSKDVLNDAGWRKYWYKARIKRITGTKWHWLDPIKKPYNKAKVSAGNQVARFLLGGQSTAGSLRGKIVSKLLGGTDQEQALNDALDRAAGDEATDIISKELVKTATKVGTGVGAALAAIQIYCNVDDFIKDDTIQKVAQQKAEIEYMTAYAAEVSKASQLKTGKTDMVTLAANMSMYSYKGSDGKSHSFESSNNYKRAVGEKVDYKASDNCENGSELCSAHIPSEVGNSTAIGRALGSLSDVRNSEAYKIIAFIIPIPGLPGSPVTAGACLAYDKVIGPALNFGAGAADFVLRNTPIVKEIWNPIKDNSAKLVESLSGSVLSALAAPVIDSNTKGPLLANAVGAGASASADSAAGGTEGTGQDESSACSSKSPEEQKSDESLCAPLATQAQAMVVDRTIAMENREQFDDSSTWNKLASLDTPYSVLSRIVDNTPMSPGVIIDNTSGTLAAIATPSTFIDMFKQLRNDLLPRAHAVSDDSTMIVDENGKDQFGTKIHLFSDGELEDGSLDDPKLHNITRNTGCAMVANLKDKNGKKIDLPSECDPMIESDAMPQPMMAMAAATIPKS